MGPAEVGETVGGAALFARFAHPPNVHGYCGPADAAAFHRAALEVVERGTGVEELRALSRAFDGAWPFLELIAARTGLDPLDARVVEAYWIGGPLLDGLDDGTLAGALAAVGGPGRRLEPASCAAGLPHHSFAVFCVYPWARLLPQPRAAAQALRVLDRCRIRTGRVVVVGGDHVVVESAPLVVDDGRLRTGPAVAETVRAALDGASLAPTVRPGDLVALHWDWLCDVLTPAQAADLERFDDRHRRLVG